MQKTTIITIIITIFFVLGAGAIIYYGRPIMDIEESPEKAVPAVIVGENTLKETENESEEEENEEESEETNESENTPTATSTTPTTTSETAPQATGTYTSAQIATHATESDCWANIDENVYDLTSWASRHPGGNKAIVSLCGTDATAKFEKKHGGSSAAKAALALLKIGTLAQ